MMFGLVGVGDGDGGAGLISLAHYEQGARQVGRHVGRQYGHCGDVPCCVCIDEERGAKVEGRAKEEGRKREFVLADSEVSSP